jgi:hypothetical protein
MLLRILAIGVPAENPDINYVSNALEAPSLFDYDIVIADVDSFLPKHYEERIPKDEFVEIQREDRSVFEKAMHKLLEEAKLLVEKGGMLVCLVRPVRGITWDWYNPANNREEKEFVSNYDWIPIPNLRYRVISGFGRRKKICDDTDPFANYLKMSETCWTAYFENIDKLNFQIQKLALNDADKPIAMHVSIGKGSIVFLPISERANAGDVLLECAARALKKARERPPPSWIKNIKIPKEDALQELLQTLAEKISKLQTEYRAAITKFEEETLIKKLLYEKDETLEEVVRSAFEELGFTLIRKDDKDWIASSDAGEAILEVTGSDGPIDIDKLRQLLNYLIDEYKESGVEKKAILVGNHFANNPPETRGEPFTRKVIEESVVHSICLLPTVELFKMVCYLREEKMKAEELRKKIVNTIGIFELNRDA